MRTAQGSAEHGEQATSHRPRRGRPPTRTEAETRRIIVEAATREFLEHGYAATSTATVAKRAGLSKRTIYQLMPSKAELFAAILTQRREDFLLPVDLSRADRMDAAGALEHVLGTLARLVLSPESVAVQRFVAAEALRFPEAALAFYQEGPGRILVLLAEVLDHLRARGLVRLDDDTASAASMLMSMVTGEPMRVAVLGLGELPGEEGIDRRVKQAVALFVRGCTTARPGRAAS